MSKSLDIPEGYKIDIHKSDLSSGKIILMPIHIRSFEELGGISGTRITSRGITIRHCDDVSAQYGKDIFSTGRQAMSASAFAQLSQLRERVIGEWFPDWGEFRAYKYVIYRLGNNMYISRAINTYRALSFETREQAETFLATHEILIKRYFEI